jgi:hypothetical protein
LFPFFSSSLHALFSAFVFASGQQTPWRCWGLISHYYAAWFYEQVLADYSNKGPSISKYTSSLPFFSFSSLDPLPPTLAPFVFVRSPAEHLKKFSNMTEREFLESAATAYRVVAQEFSKAASDKYFLLLFFRFFFLFLLLFSLGPYPLAFLFLSL